MQKIESIFVKNKKNLSKINKILPPPDRSVERGILCGKKTVPSSEKGGGYNPQIQMFDGF